jgi:uncharacterized protein Veg
MKKNINEIKKNIKKKLGGKIELMRKNGDL